MKFQHGLTRWAFAVIGTLCIARAGFANTDHLTTALGVRAQEDSATLMIDIKDRKHTVSGRLRTGEAFRVGVTNVPASLKVKVTAEGKSSFMNAPDSIKKIGLGGAALNASEPIDIAALAVSGQELLYQQLVQEGMFSVKEIFQKFSEANHLADAETEFGKLTQETVVTFYERIIEFATRLNPQTDDSKKIVEEKAAIRENALAISRAAAGEKPGTNFAGPFTVDGDSVSVKLEFSKVEGAPSTTIVPDPIEFTISMGGFKIDFSAGLLMSSLTNETYTTTEIAGSSPKVYKLNGPVSDNYNFATAAFTHFYFMDTKLGGTPAKIGLTFGVAAQTDPIYALGGSLLIGNRKQRLVLTTGIAFGKVQRLDMTQITVLPNGDLTSSSTNAPYRNVTMGRLFFALSYNF